MSFGDFVGYAFIGGVFLAILYGMYAALTGAPWTEDEEDEDS